MTVASNALALGLAGIAVLGTLAGAFIGMWSSSLIERKRQAFQREQEARSDRAQAMQAARILDSALMEAEALLNEQRALNAKSPVEPPGPSEPAR